MNEWDIHVVLMFLVPVIFLSSCVALLCCPLCSGHQCARKVGSRLQSAREADSPSVFIIPYPPSLPDDDPYRPPRYSEVRSIRPPPLAYNELEMKPEMFMHPDVPPPPYTPPPPQLEMNPECFIHPDAPPPPPPPPPGWRRRGWRAPQLEISWNPEYFMHPDALPPPYAPPFPDAPSDAGSYTVQYLHPGTTSVRGMAPG